MKICRFADLYCRLTIIDTDIVIFVAYVTILRKQPCNILLVYLCFLGRFRDGEEKMQIFVAGYTVISTNIVVLVAYVTIIFIQLNL